MRLYLRRISRHGLLWLNTSRGHGVRVCMGRVRSGDWTSALCAWGRAILHYRPANAIGRGW